jgi:glycosyltransferase involved in cell wall biosynthesis
MLNNRTRDKRALCIIAYSSYQTDGRIIKQAESASHAGYSVDVITPRKKAESLKETINSVNLFRLNIREYSGRSNFCYIISYLQFFIVGLFKVTLMHFSRRYAVIQVCNIPDFLIFMTFIARLFGAKSILDIHDPMPGTYAAKFENAKMGLVYRLLLLQERLSAAYADRIMTVHEPVKRDILMKDGIRPEKITVVTNFADDKLFHFVSDFQLERPIRMVYHGTIAARFGFGHILEILSDDLLRQRFSLKIIGEGEYEAPLKSLIQNLGLENSVDFENISYPVRQLPDILRHYHLGLVPYELSAATDYMLPVKMLELLAMGIPCVTISNVAIRYYLDEEMYFAYDPCNLFTFKDTLNRINDDPTLIKEKRKAIMKNRAKFLWSTERLKYLDLLENLSR